MGSLAFAHNVEAGDQRVSIQFDFIGETGSTMIVPKVRVNTIELSTGERKEEVFLFEDQAFNLPQGFQMKSRSEAEKIKKDSPQEVIFQCGAKSYTVNSSEGVKGYALYNGQSYEDKVIDEWTTLWENKVNRERLYLFDYATKKLSLLKEATSTEKLPPITYSYVTDIKTKKKYKEMDYWDYIYSGTSIGELFLKDDLYEFSDQASKTTKLFSLSKNTYITTIPFSQEGLITEKNLLLCERGNNCFQSEESISFNDNVVFMRGGKYYEILKNHSIKEIKKIKYDWSQYQWKITVNNRVFGQRRIDGWDYLISTDGDKIKKISERYTFVRDVTVSPDHKYLAIFEAAYNKEKSNHLYENEQLRIYDINKQQVVRIIKLPYLKMAPQDIIWQSNTVLQYKPNAASNAVYIRTVNVEILTGIITKDLLEAYDFKDEYAINASDNSNYFSFVRPLEIRYQGKPIKYSKQSSFEGENGLVYCSLKDLATGIGAEIKVEPGAVKLTLNGKTATVDLKDKQVITYAGTAYAPIKSIVLNLGLQYKRKDQFATQINLE
ncbi:hypothetical protein [Paenibacillus monticola]|uniref:Uncharacterized protein n=1 Tax=Paenibacillus monticola TaxID=2666075 RepID=A0A7X2H1L8_9BACL|nr:hypothetical protein [Paenibacillus monticola]MRN51881.1 hypothetical protein [Paenibacillus monticola]